MAGQSVVSIWAKVRKAVAILIDMDSDLGPAADRIPGSSSERGQARGLQDGWGGDYNGRSDPLYAHQQCSGHGWGYFSSKWKEGNSFP